MYHNFAPVKGMNMELFYLYWGFLLNYCEYGYINILFTLTYGYHMKGMIIKVSVDTGVSVNI